MSKTAESDDHQANNDHQADNAAEQEVGYARPPRATRFKKGQSGNPRGRPKSRRELPAILNDMLYELIPLRQGGRRRRVPKIQAAFAVCLDNALKGDLRAFERLVQLGIKLKVFDQIHRDVPFIIRRVIVDPQGMERPLPLNSNDKGAAE